MPNGAFGNPARAEAHPYRILTWTNAWFCIHIRLIMRLNTHLDADVHMGDYSQPPGEPFKLFSHDLAKRQSGSRTSTRGSKNGR